MKESKSEPELSWIEQARRILSIPKAEIDRREAQFKRRKRRKGSRLASAVKVFIAALSGSIFR